MFCFFNNRVSRISMSYSYNRMWSCWGEDGTWTAHAHFPEISSHSIPSSWGEGWNFLHPHAVEKGEAFISMLENSGSCTYTYRLFLFKKSTYVVFEEALPTKSKTRSTSLILAICKSKPGLRRRFTGFTAGFLRPIDPEPRHVSVFISIRLLISSHMLVLEVKWSAFWSFIL